MGIQFVSVKCPECGATLDIEENRQQIFCSYCGSKIMIHNDNEQIYRHIDEAGLKQAETEHVVQLKRMEMAEKNRASREKVNSLKIKISIVLGVVMIGAFAFGYAGDMSIGGMMVGLVCGFALMMMWVNNKDNEEEDDFGDKVKVPSGIAGYENKSYSAIEAMFVSAGFTNVKCIPLNDLTVGLLKKPGMVESITIRGKEVTFGGKKFSPDAPVIISYHSHR